MKGFFYVAAFAAALMFSACGKKATPEPVQALVAQMKANVEGSNIGVASFKSVEADGKDIVIEMIFDESEFGGISFKEGFEMIGINAEEMAKFFRESFINPYVVSEKMYNYLSTMHEYECDMIFRFKGSLSADVMEAVLSYKDLPEVKWEDVEALYAKYEGVPKEVVEVIGEFELVLLKEDIGIMHQGTELEGHDIVLNLLVDEEALDMDNFVTFFAEHGVTKQAIHDEVMKAIMTGNRTAEVEQQIAVLQEGQYCLVLRYLGSKSKQTMEVRITSDELGK